MNSRILRWIFVLFGLFVLGIVSVLSVARKNDDPLYAMIINSNIRDYDQAYYLMAPDGTILRRLTTIPGSEFITDRTGDDQWLIVRSNVNARTYSVHVATSTTREIGDNHAQFLTISPDSRWVYFQQSLVPANVFSNEIYRISPDGKQKEDIVKVRDGFSYFSYVGLSPDGEWLYIADENFLYRIHTQTREKQTIQTSNLGSFLGRLGWSPDGEWMYAQYHLNDQYAYYQMRPDGSGQQPLLPRSTDQISQTFFSPDHQWLFIVVYSNNGRLHLYQMRLDGSEFQLIDDDAGTFYGWSTDPEWVFFIGRYGDNPNALYKFNITDGTQRLIWKDANTSFWWSPDRQHLAFYRNTSSATPPYYLINDEGQDFRPVPHELGMILRAWSPDSEWMYFEKFEANSSELFRIRVSDGRRERVHQPAFHNNYQPIFTAWTTINAASWHGEWWLAIIVGFVGVVGLSSRFRRKKDRHE